MRKRDRERVSQMTERKRSEQERCFSLPGVNLQRQCVCCSSRSHGHREAAHGEVAGLGLLLRRLHALLLRLQRTTDRARLLRPQVQRLVLLALVGLPRLSLLLLVVHREDASDGLADDLDLRLDNVR